MNNFNPFYSQQNFNRNTNKFTVNSLEEALSRYTDFNSNIVYWDSQRNILYDVYTDGRGNKTYDIFEVSRIKTETSNVQTNNYEERFKSIESKLEELYGKYNAQQQQQSGTVPVSTDV